VGIFDHSVLVVWIGNFDGTANPQFVGRSAAAPLFFRIVDALRSREAAPSLAGTCFARTPDLNLRQVDLCPVSGMIAGPNCPDAVKGWFIPGKSPIAVCDVHRRIWIDNRTGLRLPGPPDEPASAHAEVCEFWPSDLEKLFREAGLPRSAPPALLLPSGSKPGEVCADAGQGPRIVSPKEGLIYHIRVGSADGGLLDLQAKAETSTEQLHWFVDASYLGASTPGGALPWKLAAGRHVIRAVDDLGRADSREIVVTAVE
jgi:penicillin-binding protein 1C